MKKNDRQAALSILCEMIKNKTPLNYLLNNQEITASTKNLCYGVSRYYFQLEVLAQKLLKKRPKSDIVWVSLLIGLYQLHYQQKADYAVVKETVSLLSHPKVAWAKGLVNAVLRESIRADESLFSQLQKNTNYRYNHPQWLIDRIRKDYPDQWQAILQENDKHPPMTLRVNSLRQSRAAYLHQLTETGITASAHPYANDAIILKTPCEVNELPGFQEGLVSVQDAAAQMAVELLEAKAGMRVLDACAAPGGKTCHLLERVPDLESCLALDIESRRLSKIQENLQRLKLACNLKQADAKQVADWWDKKPFERILLDAPCSATGVIRRHPDIKLLRQTEEVEAITALQADLLDKLWPLLAKGGRLVYATCSILQEENSQQMSTFLHKHPDARAVTYPQPWAMSMPYGWQILPGQAMMDGFYYCILEKDESCQ